MTSYPCNKYEQIAPSYRLSVKYTEIKRRSLIDDNRNDKKLKKNILIDVHTVTVAYLEQKLNQRIE